MTAGIRKTRSDLLAAASVFAFSFGMMPSVFAQNASTTATTPTVLSPITVQSDAPKRVKKPRAQTSSRVQAASGGRAGRGAGNAVPAASAGAGKTGVENARGHVDGYVATRSGTGTKTDTPLIETPAAISVVTQDQIQAQAAQSIPQAVRYTSGVRVEQTGADARFNNVLIRGFAADQYLDGIKLLTTGFSASIIEPFNLERVEVLHGPASILYGQASPGGLVDMVSKRPTTDPYHELFVSTGSYGRIQSGVDLSGPIDQNKEWLYRLTASGFDVGTQIDHTSYQRISIAPALTWRPDADTTITMLGTYQKDPKAGFFNQLPVTGTLMPFPNGSRIPTSFYAGEPGQDSMSRELGQVGYIAEHRFDNVWTVRQNLRYSDISSDITTVYTTGLASSSPPSVSRSAFFESDKLRSFQVDNQAEAKFATGPLLHTALFGVDYQNGSFSYLSGGAPAGFSVPPMNVFNPVYGSPIPMIPTSTRNQNFDQVGLYAQDQIKLDRWVALLGIRWDQADTTTSNRTLSNGAVTSARMSDDATTKRAALLYKFDNGISPYIQYTESFQPTAGTDFFGNAFTPTTGQQQEVGIKYQPNAKSLYTLALFNLVQQNVLTPDPDPTHVIGPARASVQTGEIRSRGLELEGKTEINRELSLIASYTYLDNSITKSNTPIQLGRSQVGLPTNTASLWADYTFHGGQLDGFGLSGGVRYIGETPGNVNGATVLSVPDVTLFDAAVHYDLAGLGRQFKGYQLQVNATNLFDKTYTGWCQDNGCYYGLRREAIATLRYKW